MSNVAIRRNEQAPLTATAASRQWDPTRLMRSVLGWDPFREMAPFTIDASMSSFSPAFEVKETKDGYLFKADLPGVRQQDVDVSYSGNRLIVSGKRDEEKQEKTDAIYAYERSYGSFTRAFTMPEGVDPSGIHAHLRDGVLTIDVAKKAEVQPKKITVTTPQDKPKG